MKERLVVFVVAGLFVFMALSGTTFAAHLWDDDFNDGVRAAHWEFFEDNHSGQFSSTETNGVFQYTSQGWPLTGNPNNDQAFGALFTPQTLSINNSFTFEVQFRSAAALSNPNEEINLQVGLYSFIGNGSAFPEDFFAGISVVVDDAGMNYSAGYMHREPLPPDEEYGPFAVRTQVDGTLYGAYSADTRIASFWTDEHLSNVQDFPVPTGLGEVESMGIILAGGTVGAEILVGELHWDNFSVVVPEPSTWVLLASALPVMALLYRRRRMLRPQPIKLAG